MTQCQADRLEELAIFAFGVVLFFCRSCCATHIIQLLPSLTESFVLIHLK